MDVSGAKAVYERYGRRWVVTWVCGLEQERAKAESAADKKQIAELKAAHQEAQQAVRSRDETPA